jgi:hypothetical protein
MIQGNDEAFDVERWQQERRTLYGEARNSWLHLVVTLRRSLLAKTIRRSQIPRLIES